MECEDTTGHHQEDSQTHSNSTRRSFDITSPSHGCRGRPTNEYPDAKLRVEFPRVPGSCYAVASHELDVDHDYQ